MKKVSIPKLTPDNVVLLGVPFDQFSSYLRGSALAPGHIRRALHCDSANLFAEDGTDLGSAAHLVDCGDLFLPDSLDAFAQIKDQLSRVLAKNCKPLVLGGDHAITLPVLRACYQQHGALDVLHLDAHSDTYDIFEGNPYSHACPFARAMEEGLIRKLVQIGIRTLTSEQRKQIERFGIEVYEMRDGQPESLLELNLTHPLYLSLDLDVLDPAFAPGVSHHEPGGLSSREVLRIIQRLPSAPVCADIVELNPTRDIHEMTAMVAAKFLREIAAQMLHSM